MRAVWMRRLDAPFASEYIFGRSLYLFVRTTAFDAQRTWADLFFRFDPLVALTVSLAGHAFVAGLTYAGITLALTLVFGWVWCGFVP
ncbi:MAG: hypothetical protein ACP5HM_16745 [Anaerolineae bacterium]